MVKHKDLQQQLVDTKLHQAQELLKESEERHDREKDFVSIHFTGRHIQKTQSPLYMNVTIIYHLPSSDSPSPAAERSCGVSKDVRADEAAGSSPQTAGFPTSLYSSPFTVRLWNDSVTSSYAKPVLFSQLSLYTEKFEEFQTTLSKSNEVFTTFKQEMEKVRCQCDCEGRVLHIFPSCLLVR